MSDTYMWQDILNDIIKEHGEDAPVTVWSPSGSWDLIAANEAADYIYGHFDHFDIDSVGVSYTTEESLDEQIVVTREYERRMAGLPSEYELWAQANPDADEERIKNNRCTDCNGSGATPTGGRCKSCEGSGFRKP